MTQDKKFLGTEPVGRLLWRLAVPTVIAQLVNMLYNIVDRIYIGHIPETGSMALTGVGVCLPIIMVISAFAALMAFGGAPRASIAEGRGDLKESERIMGNSFTMLVAVSVVLTVVFLVFAEPMLRIFGASDNTIGYALNYMRIYALGTIFVQVTLGMNAYITAQGFTVVGMKTVLIGAILNTVLDPIFIFGWFGLPAMGVTGAAIATVTGQILAMLFAVYVMVRKEHAVHITFKGFHLSGAIVRDIFQVGFPSIIMQSIGSVMIMALNNILIVFSQAAVAVLGVYFKLQSFVFMPVFGLGAGALPIMGFNYGARNKKRLMHTLQLTCAIAFGIMLVGLLIFQFGARYLLMMFNASTDMMDIGISALRTISLCFPAAGLGIAFSNFFQAIGEGKNSLLISVLRQLVILLPCAWIISRIGTLNQVWLAFPIAEVFSFFVSLLLTRITYNNKIKEMENFTTDED